MYARVVVTFSAFSLFAAQIPVRHVEGRVHGFLVLRDMEDRLLASGSLIQDTAGNRVTSQLDFRLKDGSVHQETSVFSQQRAFRLLNYRLVQKAPAFKPAPDMNLNASTGHPT